MVLPTVRLAGQPFAKLICMFGLTVVFAAWSANAEIVFGQQQEPDWIVKALEGGALDQKTLELMRHRVSCQPAACPAAWVRAMDWLKSNSLSIETVPDITNNTVQFKSAMGNLRKYPDVKIVIQMKTWRSGALIPEIDIEHFDHYGESWNGLAPSQLVQDAKIFADFKSYMLSALDSPK